MNHEHTKISQNYEDFQAHSQKITQDRQTQRETKASASQNLATLGSYFQKSQKKLVNLTNSHNKYKKWCTTIHQRLSTNTFQLIDPTSSKPDRTILSKVLKGEKLTLGDLDLNVVDSTEIFMNKVTNEQQLYQRELVGNGFGLCQKPLGLDSPEDHESQWYSDIRLSEYPPVAADLG